ncbi:hypothetical protein [Flavisolibacter nicotianae]|uniref:hypothetical protein n=1 Tax=Flavisolibacter nicotianae TaxID=2364882 RepID=UPI000EB52327|nr:hypothetical protein [Flavisolibacter nicotianae]
MKKTYFFVLLATFVICACQKEAGKPPAEPEPPRQVWPLAMGNMWIYNRSAYFEDGTLKSSFADTLIVTTTLRKEKKLYYQLSWRNSTTETFPFLRSEESAVYAYSDSSDHELAIFRQPTQEGEVLFSETFGDQKQECIASAAALSLDTAQTNHVTINNWEKGVMTSYLELDLKPGIGLSRQVSYKRKASGQNFYRSFEATLSSYRFH